jgi:hypothetical protein
VTVELGALAVNFLVLIFGAGVVYSKVGTLEKEVYRLRDRLERFLDDRKDD